CVSHNRRHENLGQYPDRAGRAEPRGFLDPRDVLLGSPGWSPGVRHDAGGVRQLGEARGQSGPLQRLFGRRPGVGVVDGPPRAEVLLSRVRHRGRRIRWLDGEDVDPVHASAPGGPRAGGGRGQLTALTVELRPATVGDADAAADVYLRSRKELVACAPLAHSDEDVRDWIRGRLIPAGRTTVAVADGLVVGLVSVASATDGSWIEQLYLHPAWIARGIGTRLLELAR